MNTDAMLASDQQQGAGRGSGHHRGLGWPRAAAAVRRLRAAAVALDAEAADLIPLATPETHRPQAGVKGELAWTTWQLRLFAEVLEEGFWLGAVIDHADAGSSRARCLTGRSRPTSPPG
jgi:hypothetical protein